MAKVNKETSSYLVHKFNPSRNEAQRTTVEAMIYTAGTTGITFIWYGCIVMHKLTEIFSDGACSNIGCQRVVALLMLAIIGVLPSSISN